MEAEKKLIKLLLLFLNKDEYTKIDIEYQLCQLEHYLDPRLAIFNCGSTLMHTIEAELTEKNKLISMILKSQHSIYLLQFIQSLTTNRIQKEDSVIMHFQEHQDYINDLIIQQQVEQKEQAILRETIIAQRKQTEINNRQQEIQQLEFVNVIAEDTDDELEELNEEGLDVHQMNQYWDNQYQEYIKKQRDKDKQNTQHAIYKISMGDIQSDQIKQVNKNIQYLNDSLLTIAEDNQEKFTTEYFQDIANTRLVAPIKNIKSWFNFSQNTQNLDTLYDSDGLGKQSLDPMSKQHDLKALQSTAERYLDDELLRTQLVQNYLGDVYQMTYIGAMVEVVERKERDALKQSVQIDNAYHELDVMLNGPVHTRHKDMSLQVIHEELLDEDALEQARIESEVDSRYQLLKKKQAKIQDQNVIIFQSKIKEIQTKYKGRDDKRVTQLQDRVTQKLSSEAARMTEAIGLAQLEKDRATQELEEIKHNMNKMKADKDLQINLQKQQQEQLIVQQEVQDKLMQENIKQEKLLIEQQERESALASHLENQKEKENQLGQQLQEQEQKEAAVQEQLAEQTLINKQKIEELEQILENKSSVTNKSIISIQQVSSEPEEEEEEDEEEEEESSSEEEGLGVKAQRGCTNVFEMISNLFVPPPKASKKNRNRGSSLNSSYMSDKSKTKGKDKDKDKIKQSSQKTLKTKSTGKKSKKKSEKSFISDIDSDNRSVASRKSKSSKYSKQKKKKK